jgi:hypothetical protein
MLTSSFEISRTRTRSAISRVCATSSTKWWTRPPNVPGQGTSYTRGRDALWHNVPRRAGHSVVTRRGRQHAPSAGPRSSGSRRSVCSRIMNPGVQEGIHKGANSRRNASQAARRTTTQPCPATTSTTGATPTVRRMRTGSPLEAIGAPRKINAKLNERSNGRAREHWPVQLEHPVVLRLSSPLGKACDR